MEQITTKANDLIDRLKNVASKMENLSQIVVLDEIVKALHHEMKRLSSREGVSINMRLKNKKLVGELKSIKTAIHLLKSQGHEEINELSNNLGNSKNSKILASRNIIGSILSNLITCKSDLHKSNMSTSE